MVISQYVTFIDARNSHAQNFPTSATPCPQMLVRKVRAIKKNKSSKIFITGLNFRATLYHQILLIMTTKFYQIRTAPEFELIPFLIP